MGEQKTTTQPGKCLSAMGTQGQACNTPDELGGVGVPGTALVILVSFVRGSLAAKTNDSGTGKMLLLGKERELRVSWPGGSLLGRVWFQAAQAEGAAGRGALTRGESGTGRDFVESAWQE